MSPGRHHHLLFDLFAVEDFHARRLIVDAAARPGGRYRNFFFDGDGRLVRRRLLCLLRRLGDQQRQNNDRSEHYLISR